MQKKHSGKMGAIALPVALIAAAVGVLLWMLTGAQGYRAADWTDTDGQRYYRNLVTHQAFAADVDWDGSDGAVIVIPDEVHGYKVTALGGYIGRGVPTAFALNAPEIWNTQVVFGDEKVAADAEKDYPNAKIVDCTVTLRLGRAMTKTEPRQCGVCAGTSNATRGMRRFTPRAGGCIAARMGRLWKRSAARDAARQRCVLFPAYPQGCGKGGHSLT